VARTTDGYRCGNPISYGQPTAWHEFPVAGSIANAVVSGFDLDNDGELFLRRDADPGSLRARWLEQRCFLHYGSAAASYVEPEWRRFDRKLDGALMHTPRIEART